MVTIARYHAERRFKGSMILSVAVAAVSLFFVFLFPSFKEGPIDDVVDSFPPAMVEMFGIEAMDTVEGFLAVEIYNFIWVLLLGIYFAYTAAGIVAKDIESGHFDILLSYPISRRRVIVERFAALIVPLVLLNLIVGVVIYGGVIIIGESMEIERLFMVHLMSIPFFLSCAAIGAILSASVNRVSVSQRIAFGVVFLLWFMESMVATVEDFEWLAWLSPTTYYNPTDILVHADYNMSYMAVLLGGTIVLLVISATILKRRDI